MVKAKDFKFSALIVHMKY